MIFTDDIFHDPSRQVFQDVCHLVSDVSLPELHALAERLGLKREWFHRHEFPHYKLTPNKRAQALRLGVQATTREEVTKLAQQVCMCAVVTKRPCDVQAHQRCHNPECDYPGGRPICGHHSYLVMPVWSLGRKPQTVCLRCVRHPDLRAARAQVLGTI